MPKQSINRKETKVSTEQGVGQQVEQVFTVDDNSLPTPQELIEYKKIDPRIVDFLIDSSIKEQAHRHKLEDEKLSIIKNSERSVNRMNWWGMFYAFLSLVVIAVITIFALYFDKSWFAGIFGGLGVVSIITIFVEAGKAKK